MAFLNSAVIPDHILKMMNPDERKKLGKGAITLDEAIVLADDRAERQLQKDILALLEAHRGVVVIYSRMDRKATTPPGTPDFIFAVRGYVWDGGDQRFHETLACAWEIKTQTGAQSAEQVEMQKRMETRPNAWRYRVIRSVQEARTELAAMGV